MARWVSQQALFPPGFGFSYCLSSYPALPWYWSVSCNKLCPPQFCFWTECSIPATGKQAGTCYKMSFSHFYPLFLSFILSSHHCKLQIKIIETEGSCAIHKLHLKKLKKNQRSTQMKFLGAISILSWIRMTPRNLNVLYLLMAAWDRSNTPQRNCGPFIAVLKILHLIPVGLFSPETLKKLS